jgi:uncharacterized protein YraI
MSWADYNCRVTARRLVLGVFAALLAGCAPTPDTVVSVPSAAFITATLPVTERPTATNVIETAAATLPPSSIAGSTATQVNVRQEPLASGRVLGTLAASAAVDVLARDPAGNWFQIAYEAGDGGRGWVAAQYVRVPTGSTVPLASFAEGPAASVRERINVRSGPGTQFDGVGLLEARDVVTLTGKDRTGAWLQIRFAESADGRAWVAASFLEGASTDDLPIITEAGEVVGTSTPTVIGPSATPTPARAVEDGDTATAPAVDARFSPAGIGSVFYTSDLSAPEGDSSDWIQFTPYYDSITIRLDCRGNGEPAAGIMNEGAAVPGLPALECGTSHVLNLQAGTVYALHLSIAPTGTEQTYLAYTVSLFAVPAT